MEYGKYIGKEVYISYKAEEYLNYDLWRRKGFPTQCIIGEIINGTMCIVVIKSEDKKEVLRLSDELIVSCRILIDDDKITK